jgi:O-antigen/teichoic acid export membrane protein
MLVLNTLTGVVLARLLGPTGRGQLAAILLWPGLLATIGSLGLAEAVTFFTARMAGKERDVLGSALLVAFVDSALLGALWYLASPWVLSQYGEGTIRTSRYMVCAFPLALVSMATIGVLVGRLQMGFYNRQRLSGIALTAFGLIGLYGLGRNSLTSIVFIYIAVGVVVLGYSVAAVARRAWLGFRPDASLVRKLLGYGVRSHVGTVSGLANERADLALISIVLSPIYLGLYSIAVTLPSTIAMIGSSLAVIALPAISAVGTDADRRTRLGQFVRATLVLSALAAAAMFAVTPMVIALFFGPAFLPAAPVAQVLVLASILLSINRVTSAGLRAFNRPFRAGAGDLVAAGVTVASLTLLVPRLGIMGAAIASLIAYAANFSFNFWTCRRLGISTRDMLMPNSSDLRWLQALVGRRLSAVWRS